MIQYLYYHEYIKQYFLHNEKGTYGDNVKFIGEVSEIVKVYRDNLLTKSIEKAKPNMDKIKNVDTFLEAIKIGVAEYKKDVMLLSDEELKSYVCNDYDENDFATKELKKRGIIIKFTKKGN